MGPSLLFPAIYQALELANRAACANNLRQIGQASHAWAKDHRLDWPDVLAQDATRWDEVGKTRKDWYDVASGDDVNWGMKAEDQGPGTPVNSNTANFWALISQGQTTPDVFLCPSAYHLKDQTVVDFTRVRDFRAENFVSYSYQNVLGAYSLTETGGVPASALAVAADANPMRRDFFSAGRGSGITNDMLARRPKFEESDETEPWNSQLAEGITMPWELNSPNHKFKGQNVLYFDGHVAWRDHPYCGLFGDNIWLRRLIDVPGVPNMADIRSARSFNDEASYDGNSTLHAGCNNDSFLVP
jgi:prepilin-type processing-associated H-X9-DG protein